MAVLHEFLPEIAFVEAGHALSNAAADVLTSSASGLPISGLLHHPFYSLPDVRIATAGVTESRSDQVTSECSVSGESSGSGPPLGGFRLCVGRLSGCVTGSMPRLILSDCHQCSATTASATISATSTSCRALD